MSVSDHQPVVEPELGASRCVLCLPDGDPKSDLYDQCHRISEHVIAEDHQDAWIIPDERRGDQVAVLIAAEYQPEVDNADQRMEGSTQPVQHYL